MLLKFAESGHPIFRATTPLSRGQLKSKGKGKVSIHFTADQDTVDTIYRIILSVNQLSVYGAVAAICDEYESHQDSTGQPVILMGQSIVLGEIKAEVPVHDENPETTKSFLRNMFNKLNHFHQKTEWVNSVRKQDLCVLSKLDNISWPETLVILDNFNQWLVANTPFHRDDKASQPKGWIRGNMRMDLYWKSRPVFSTSSTELKFELSPWIKTIVILGSEFLMEQSNMWTILLQTTQKILQIHKKRKMYQQAQVWLQPGQRQKQNLNRGIYWHDNYTIKWKNVDWYWTIKARSRFVRSLEESRQSSSTQSEVTSRRRWSNSILQDKIPSTRTIILEYKIGPMIDG